MRADSWEETAHSIVVEIVDRHRRYEDFSSEDTSRFLIGTKAKNLVYRYVDKKVTLLLPRIKAEGSRRKLKIIGKRDDLQRITIDYILEVYPFWFDQLRWAVNANEDDDENFRLDQIDRIIAFMRLSKGRRA